LTEPTDPASAAPTDPVATAPATPVGPSAASAGLPGQAWSPAATLRALSWWLGSMALGGMVFGMYGAQRPSGGGLITHPLTVFCGLALVGLLILRFAGDRPLVSDRSLAAGVVLGIASYFLGTWFGTALLVVR
jgi:hypothetical protein